MLCSYLLFFTSFYFLLPNTFLLYLNTKPYFRVILLSLSKNSKLQGFSIAVDVFLFCGIISTTTRSLFYLPDSSYSLHKFLFRLRWVFLCYGISELKTIFNIGKAISSFLEVPCPLTQFHSMNTKTVKLAFFMCGMKIAIIVEVQPWEYYFHSEKIFNIFFIN